MSIKPFPLDITYDQYCAALASIEGKEVAFNLPGALLKWVAEAKSIFQEIADAASLSVGDLLVAFQSRDVFAIMKAVGFSLKRLLKSLVAVSSLITKGLLVVMEEVAASDIFKKLQDGTAKIDDVLNKYPMLKRLAGPALAGLLFYMWLNMSFIGDFKYDMDLSTVIDAFKGTFSLTDLFTSPHGLAFVSLFVAGAFTGISVTWMASSAMNVIVALCFTGARRLKKAGLAFKLKPLLEHKRYR